MSKSNASYCLMHKNYPVAELEIDMEKWKIIKVKKVLNKLHMPYCIKTEDKNRLTESLDTWWASRCIPENRSGLKKAVEALGLNSERELVTKNMGFSLSDQYWMRPTDSSIRWENGNFFENEFSDGIGSILLNIDRKESNSVSLHLSSPDNTSNGELPKAWKIIDGKRLLFKSGSGNWLQEPLNEVIASMIMDRLSIPHVKYQLKSENIKGYIDLFCICECFITPETELVTEDQFMMNSKIPDQMSHYQYYIDCCKNVGITNAQLRVDQMIVIDFLIANSDRHTNNFGLIRNADNLKFVDIAPIYDNGSSLWYDSQDDWIAYAKDISKPFANRHYKQIKFVSNFDWLELNKLEGFENEMKKIFDESPYISQKRQEIICENFKKRIRLLQKYINERKKNPDYDPELDVEFNPGKEGISQFEDDPENIVDPIHFS